MRGRGSWLGVQSTVLLQHPAGLAGGASAGARQCSGLGVLVGKAGPPQAAVRARRDL